LTLLLVFAQCTMHCWWLVTWLDLAIRKFQSPIKRAGDSKLFLNRSLFLKGRLKEGEVVQTTQAKQCVVLFCCLLGPLCIYVTWLAFGD
jgi:hypothetical protein